VPNRTTALAFALALPLLAACGSDPAQPKGPNDFASTPTVNLPGPQGVTPPGAAAPGDPTALPGVDTKDLTGREFRLWWNLTHQLYAPCPDQAVSVAQCVKESRSCAACVPAAQLLANKVRDGGTADDLRATYAARFGPNLKKVDVADSPARGPADAPVTVMVWSDFQCPHCRMTLPILDKVFDKYAPRVRLVHKFYPLQAHTHAEGSARAAIAAQNQGKYWEMERLLFGHQDAQTQGDLDNYAKELKLDLQKFHADMSAEKTTKIIDRDRADADKAGLNGTPFILINGREFDLTYFHPDRDLDAWVALELELLGKKAAAPQPAAQR
jgi:predicted DsbA family dithiol-disulfide isomerase